MVYDHVDGLKPAPHDITTVQDRMNGYFKVCIQVCYIRVNKVCVCFSSMNLLIFCLTCIKILTRNLWLVLLSIWQKVRIVFCG